MNVDIKAQWLAKLRDPATKQTTGTLNRAELETLYDGRVIPPGQCCLGVLCEIAADAGVVERSREEDKIIGYMEGSHLETGVLPLAVMRWAGIPDLNPAVMWEEEELGLAQLNDRGTPFSRIADIIEEQL